MKQVFFTRKPHALYAITAGWPGAELVLRRIRVPAHPVVTMLGVPGELKAVVRGDSLVITMPALGPEDAPCRHAYALKIAGGEVLPD